MRRWAMAAAMASAVTAAPTAFAGPWARRAGGTYCRLGAAMFEGRGAFLLSAEAVATGRFVSVAGEFYSEVGLGRHLELDGSVRWVENRNERDDGRVMRNAGAEDVELVLKWSPLSGDVPIAFLLGGRSSLYERLPTPELIDGTPQRGPGGTDLLTGAAWGVSFWPTRAWMSVEAMHRLRFGGSSSGVRLRVEGGGYVLGPVAVAGTLEFQAAYGREHQQPEGAPAPVPRVLGLGAKVFATVFAGVGVNVDAMWLPDVFNDASGWRVGVSLTYERR